MPPQRTDAAHIAPYLTHLITHHGQVTLVPADNNGRRRKAKQNNRNSPREEPVRFNSGPTAESSGRRSRRIGRSSRTERQYNDYDIPDYPPPSFQEAISSPPVSVCPSTTTLGQFTLPQTSRHDYNSDSDSESDDASLADTGNLPLPSPQSQPTRGRGILDSDPDDPPYTPSSSNPHRHRRHLSLSPLRTLFPTRSSRESGPALSAHSTPSPHSLAFSRSSPFFRSSTSLRNLTSATPLTPPSPSSAPSVRSENLLGPRRFFSHKGKERATSEALDSWEIVESELPAVPTTPSRPQEVSSIHGPPTESVSPRSAAAAPIHPLSERDRQTKSRSQVLFPSSARVRERHAPPPPPPIIPPAPVVTPGAGPPIVTVRTKKPPPPPPPKKKAPPVSSPLRTADRPCALPELDLDRAVRTPLPLTPVTGSPTSPFALWGEPGSPGGHVAHSVPPLTPHSSSGASEHEHFDVENEGQHLHQSHYPGRPLPRRPRVIVDSTYAPHPDFPQGENSPVPSVPEGLLIDLDDGDAPNSQTPQPQPLASISADLNQLNPMATEMQRTSSASSVDLAPPTLPRNDFMEVTDLDVLLARLENDQHDGMNYEALWLVSEFIGPATPVRAAGPRPATAFRQPAIKTSLLLTGHIEVQRRRTTKDGRVKLKLALLGVAVDRCGICMSQFKKAEHARLSEGCKHAFHDRCLARWVARSRTCPLCRVVLNLEGEGSRC